MADTALFIPHVEYESGWFSSMFMNNRTGQLVNGSMCKHTHKHEHTARKCAEKRIREALWEGLQIIMSADSNTPTPEDS